MKTFLLSSIAVLAFVSALHAQSDPKAPPLPKGPLIVRPPADSRTVITVTGPAKAETAGQPNAPKVTVLKRTTLSHSGDTSLEDSVEVGGRKNQTWQVGTYRVVYDLVSKDTSVSAGASDASSGTDAASGYPGFEWISAKNFTGVEKVRGKDYIIFKDPAEEAVAYVDLATRLPASVKQADLTSTYEFAAAPAEALVVPAEVTKAISDYKARQEAASRRAVRPY